MKSRGWGVTAIAAVLAVLPASASAATITPDTFADDDTNNGNCTLREAVISANNDVADDACAAGSGADEIPLSAGTYQLSVPGTDEDVAANGDLDVLGDLVLTGAGSSATTIDGGGAATGERVLSIDPVIGGASPAVDVSELTITGGTGSAGLGIQAEGEARTTLTEVSVSGNSGASLGGGIFNEDDATMAIRDSVVSGNTLTGSLGAGIMNQNDAVITIERTTVSGNIAGGGSGGGLMNQNQAMMTVLSSTVADNTAADGRAGGVFNQNQAVLTMENSTVSGNSAPAEGGLNQGGGFFIQNQSPVTLVNTTISDNRSAVDGGGIYTRNDPTISLLNSTVTGNETDSNGNGTGEGGGISVDPTFTGTITIANTIVAQNSDPSSAPDCSGALTSQGSNLIGDATGCTFSSTTGDQVGSAGAPIDPLLGSLADNGGPTQTQALLAGSPALDAADAATSPPSDERGVPRPQGAGPDIGAYELATCQGAVVNRVGTSGDDDLTGTENPDAFLLLAGNDAAAGLGGNDAFCGDAGNDSMNGDAGNDSFDGGEGDDTGSGGEGDDTALGLAGNDSWAGDAGNDLFDGGDGNDFANGGDGNDQLKGLAGKDKLKGGNGKDKLKGGNGKDKLNGGKGKDKLNGGKSRDTCKGAGGKDKGKGCEREKQIP